MEIPWLLLLWTALFGAVLSYDVDEDLTTGPHVETFSPATIVSTVADELTTNDMFEEEWVGPMPGFEFKVTHHGLNYAANMVIDTLMLKLMNLTIPDMRDEIGPASVSIHSVRVVEFPRPRSALRLIPNQGLRWRAKGLSPIIKANYEALISLGFWDVDKAGVMTIIGKKLQFSLDFFIGRGVDGRPTVTVFDCTARGDIDLKFEGGWSDALNLGSRIFRKKIKSIILNQVCSNAKDEINEKTGWALSRFNLVEDIPPDMEIDFSLVRFPAFKNHSVHSFHSGTFYYKPNKHPPPFKPAEIPFFPKHRRKMVYLYITSYMLNSAFYALYENNKLSVNVTSKEIPAHAKKYLAPSCSKSICLGSLIPELAQYYPTSDVELRISATQAPTVTIDSGKVRLTGSSSAHIYATEGKTPVRILSVSLNVTGAVRVVVRNETVMFNVSDLRSRAVVEYSKMGVTNSNVFENMVNTAAKEFLLPVLKDIGGTGFALPEMDNVRLIKPTIINVNGLKDVMVIASDFEILSTD